jgi:hypothetical protein
MLRAHSLVCNGGVLHAVVCLTADELRNAESGYRFYGFNAAASLLAHARVSVMAGDKKGADEDSLDRQYLRIIPDDEALVRRSGSTLNRIHPDTRRSGRRI